MFWVAHYVVLGYPLAAIVALLISVQLIVSSVLEPKFRRPVIIVFLILYWISAVITVEESYHVLPALGATAILMTMFLKRSVTMLLPVIGTSMLSLSLLSERSVVVRLGAMTSFALWMGHGFFTGSVVEILANAIPLIAALYGLVTHDLGISLRPFVFFDTTARKGPDTDK